MKLRNIKPILILIVLVLLVSCTKDHKKQNPFEVSSNRIGVLDNTTQLYQLDSLYSNDSIVKASTNNKFLNPSNEIKIYEKGGRKLLILEPRNPEDSLSTIANIQIIDPRFKTASGLSCKSFFKDIKDHYKISKINNTLSAAVLFTDSIQAYFTISKKELPIEYRFNTDTKIEASKIPDSAKIKHFLVSWDEN